MKKEFLPQRAFSLVELLAVIAMISVMIGMLAPSIAGFNSTAGRRGAVNMLMNTFEHARVAALEGGSDVYVIMQRRESPDPDRIIVFREHGDLDDGAAGAWIQLSRWQQLPQGVLFFPSGNSLTSHDSGIIIPPELRSALPGGLATNAELFAIVFNRHGQVAAKIPEPLDLYLAEAIRDGGETTQKGASQQITEKFTFARYTGRAQLEISDISSAQN